MASEPLQIDRLDRGVLSLRGPLTMENVSPFLNAFRINYYLVEQNSDGSRISMAFEEARATKRPVCVLVGDEYHGFNR